MWARLIADGGRGGRCGWLKDKFGLSWHFVPRQMLAMLKGPDAAKATRAMAAMMTMR